MDTSVGHQLMKGQTTDLTTNRIKGRDNDSLWGVVYHELHATGSLQSTDISTLTTDYTTLDIVVVDMEDANGVLNSGLSGYALNSLDHNLLGLGICIQLRLVHDLVDIAGSIGARLIFHGFYQSILGFFSTQTRELFQFGTLLCLHLLQLLLFDIQELLLVVDTVLLVVKLVLSAS